MLSFTRPFLTDKMSSNWPSPFVIHYWRVYVRNFYCASHASSLRLASVREMNINPTTAGREGRATSTLMKQTSFLRHILPFSAEGSWWYFNNATTSFPFLFVAFINGKSRRAVRQWFCCLLKRRVSYHHQSALGIPRWVCVAQKKGANWRRPRYRCDKAA